MHNRSSKPIVSNSGPESELAKFYRLLLLLQLQPKRSTPTDSNTSLHSDSAALLLSTNEAHQEEEIDVSTDCDQPDGYTQPDVIQ